MTPGWVPILRFTRPDHGQREASSRGAALDRAVRLPTSSWTDRAADGVPPAGAARGGRARHRALALGAGKQRSLFAMLLLHANEIVSTDRLIDALWGADAAADGGQDRAGLRVAAAQGARRRPARHPRPPVTPCRSSRAELDLARFEQLLDEARRSDPGARRPDAAAGAGAVARAARSPTWPTRRSRSPRSPGSRSCAGRRSSSGSTPISPPAAHAGADRRAGRARGRASAPGAAALPADARALPLGPPGGGARARTARRSASSPTSSGSSRARSSGGSSRRSCSQDPALDLAAAAVPGDAGHRRAVAFAADRAAGARRRRGTRAPGRAAGRAGRRAS